MENKIKAGDVVRLKSKSPEMTVISVIHSEKDGIPSKLSCIYWDESRLEFKEFKDLSADLWELVVN